MSQSGDTTPQTFDQQDLEAVLTALRTAPETALGTETVADRAGLPPGVVADALDRLERRGAVTKVDLEGEYVGWETGRQVVTSRADGDSVIVRDEATGISTRGATRSMALRRLATRIEDFEAGESVGAQLLGIADAAISPDYLDGLDDLRERFVDPSHTTLYVHDAEEGVVAVHDADGLNRSREVEGFAVTAVLDREEFDEAMFVDAATVESMTQLEPEHFPIGLFKVVAVPPEYQQRGIGTALTTHAMADLAQTPPVLAMLWDREDGANERLAELFDSDRLATFEGASPLDLHCTECGYHDECTCDSVLYAWGLDLVAD